MGLLFIYTLAWLDCYFLLNNHSNQRSFEGYIQFNRVKKTAIIGDSSEQ
jgi:hypothetical protein